jgi:hypothetical protein
MKKCMLLFIFLFAIVGYSKCQQNKLQGSFWIYDNDRNDQKAPMYFFYSNIHVYKIVIYPQSIGGETLYVQRYGFYNSCNLPSLDSLKQQGNYYFEVDSLDFADEKYKETMVHNSCGELHIFTVGKDTMMNIYYSSSQQYVTYKKIKALPEKVTKYLKNKEIKIFASIRKHIKSNKAMIYSQPDIPTQMYLIKGDVVEILEEKGDWLRINYYPEKDGKETERTIEGWIKKTDME